MAMVFVPVVFHFGLVTFIVPSVWGVAAFGRELWKGNFGIAVFCLLHLLFYFGFFVVIGSWISWLAARIPWKAVRWAFRVGILIILLLSSFARVITYSSIQGRGGSYTFWGAMKRVVEKERMR